MAGWIVTRAMAGVAALLLAPFKVHHVVGYVYVGGIFLLAPLGACVQAIAEACARGAFGVK
jgi:hypothetical protein